MKKIIPIVRPEVQAREKFAAHVQSVAFQISLSRKMIDLLQVVRDYGFPHCAYNRNNKEENDAHTQTWLKNRECVRISNGTEQFSMFMHAIVRRGLVYANPKEHRDRKDGDRAFLLSRAGELVCDLLVEAGLMAPAQESARERRRAR